MSVHFKKKFMRLNDLTKMLCAIWRNLNIFLSFFRLQSRQIYKKNQGWVDVGRTTTFCITTTRFMSHNLVVQSCMTKLLSLWTHLYRLMVTLLRTDITQLPVYTCMHRVTYSVTLHVCTDLLKSFRKKISRNVQNLKINIFDRIQKKNRLCLEDCDRQHGPFRYKYLRNCLIYINFKFLKIYYDIIQNVKKKLGISPQSNFCKWFSNQVLLGNIFQKVGQHF